MTTARKALLTFLVVGIAGAGAGIGSYSAFTATTGNSGNAITAGSVAIEDNDNGTALFTTLTNMKPGDSETSCIKVKYTGSLAATVRLYASVSGSLKDYLDLTVTRGTDSNPSYDSCTNFSAAGEANYIGQGPGVVYSGTLAAFPTSYSAGLVDPTSGSPESWTMNEQHSYKLTLTLQNQNAAQGLTATAGFTWEARDE